MKMLAKANISQAVLLHRSFDPGIRATRRGDMRTLACGVIGEVEVEVPATAATTPDLVFGAILLSWRQDMAPAQAEDNSTQVVPYDACA